MTTALTVCAQAQKDSVLSKVDSLKPVVVRPNEIRPRSHHDTIDYNTGSIQLRPNANVEELLARLPGLHIDPNGTITFNGEVITRLLVDGEDIFGSDPSLITRNFDASRIARVQLLNRKSDRARLSGIDDGSRVKTLNLVLKDDSKKGYFGKLEAGANAGGNYNANGLLGIFQEHEQIVALGVTSNIGTTMSSGGASGAYPTIVDMSVSSDALSASAGQGIPQFSASALHYSNIWEPTGDHLVGNYQFGKLLTRPTSTSISIQTLPGSIYVQRDRAGSINRQAQHLGYGTFDWKMNERSSLQINYHYSDIASNNQFSDSSSNGFNNQIFNVSRRMIQSNVRSRDLGGNIDWYLQSKKKEGRVFGAGFGFNNVNSNTSGAILSSSDFYDSNGVILNRDTIDQHKKFGNLANDFSGILSFNEPLGKQTSLGFRYDLIYATNQSRQFTYDRGDGKYQDLVDSLSGDLNNHSTNQSGVIVFQNRGNRLNFSISTGLHWYSYSQKNMFTDSSSYYRQVNFVSNLVLDYSIRPNTRINLEYLGSAQQPGVSQLLALKNNNDPTHIQLGNPHLQSGYDHNLKVSVNNTGKLLYSLDMNLNLNTTGISARTITDSFGRQVSQPVNVNGNHILGLNFSLSKKAFGLDAGVNCELSYGRSVNYVGSSINYNDAYTGGAGIVVGKFVANRYSFQLNSNLNYFETRSSINTNTPVQYWTQSHSLKLSLFYLKGTEISSSANFIIQGRTTSFEKGVSMLFWNSGIGHYFMNNRLEVKLMAVNLFNQNSRSTRTSTENLNTQVSANALGRYGLASLSYHFDHKIHRK